MDFGHGDGRYGSAAIDDNTDVLSVQEVLSSLRGGPLKVGRRGLVLPDCTDALQQAQHGGGRLQAGQGLSNVLLGTLSSTLHALPEQQSSTARRYVCFCYARTVHRRESNPQAIKPGIGCKYGFYWDAYVLVWLLTRNGGDGAPHIFESPTVISPARRRKSAQFPGNKMNQQYRDTKNNLLYKHQALLTQQACTCHAATNPTHTPVLHELVLHELVSRKACFRYLLESGVCISSISMILPSASLPNSYLVSTSSNPLSAASC